MQLQAIGTEILQQYPRNNPVTNLIECYLFVAVVPNTVCHMFMYSIDYFLYPIFVPSNGNIIYIIENEETISSFFNENGIHFMRGCTIYYIAYFSFI